MRLSILILAYNAEIPYKKCKSYEKHNMSYNEYVIMDVGFGYCR
jgi:hypothetical protein